MAWLGIALLLVLAADMMLKNGNWWLVTSAMVLGAIAAIPVKKAYESLGFGDVAIYWACLVLISSLCVAYFYYHETLTWQKLTGAGLALVAIYLTGK